MSLHTLTYTRDAAVGGRGVLEACGNFLPIRLDVCSLICIFAAKFHSNTYLLWLDQSEKPPC